ncbi:indole-3-glycerol-phosphate synthase [Hyphobacterium sp. HN65]|uniref:indole-3-glycerol-phosphate synthase n=1 Tax=Hyphobacterium lacteum TaxID=3116575 RepID=A0ABU7LSG6_9PROT|nr:indole-3-glycerol-phosphate synthase [Hyphobacterium sp. HN65]MEE2526815.1 indole-3-glycerol-phosphate synthase [Hyphobacterium sp. HN65]
MSGDFLSGMAKASRLRADALLAEAALPALRRRALETAPPIAPALSLEGFDLIAEIKPRSPSQGVLQVQPDPAARARLYAKAGATIISVLTEPSRFDGSLEMLQSAAIAARHHAVPVMRKDFLVDPVQVLEARAAGASGILLITRLLSEGQLADMIGCASEMGLFVLLEAFDQSDLARSLALASSLPEPALVGINSRDLKTLDIETGRFAKLIGQFTPPAIPVAESGLSTPEDAASAAALGYRLALVGSSLMRTSSPGDLITAMLRAGRTAATQEVPA